MIWPISTTHFASYYVKLPHEETPTSLQLTSPAYAVLDTSSIAKFTAMVKFNISSTFLDSMDYVFFACHESAKPKEINGTWYFKKHQLVNSRSLWVNVNQCDLLPANPLLYINITPNAFVGISCYYVILICCCIFFRNEQPMKSRGLSPVLFLFFGYGFNISTFPAYFFDGEWIATKSCFVSASMNFPIISILLSLLFINNLRFVFLMLLNKNKSWIYGHKGTIFTKFIVLLKYLTSDLVNIIFVIVVFVSFLFLEGILALITNGRCTFTLLGIYFLLGLFVFTMILGNILVIALDIVVTIKDVCQGKCKDVFIKSDPFFFRLQQTFGMLVMVMLIVVGGFLTFAVLGVVTRLQGVDRGITLAASIAFTTLNIIVSFYLSGFVLLLTLFNSLKLSIQKWRGRHLVNPDSFMKTTSELQKILNDEEVSKYFRKFCESEWSVENYLSYRDIEKYKNSKVEDRSKLAEDIYYAYFNGSRSELEVNVTQELCAKVKKNIDDGKFDDEIFDAILRTILGNLNDTVSRFRFTPEYVSYEKNNKVLQDQIIVN